MHAGGTMRSKNTRSRIHFLTSNINAPATSVRATLTHQVRKRRQQIERSHPQKECPLVRIKEPKCRISVFMNAEFLTKILLAERLLVLRNPTNISPSTLLVH